MENRRRFLQASAAAAMVPSQVLGANDRIQMGLIGCGNRGNQVYEAFANHSDVVFIAACDVNKARLEATAAKIGGNVDSYADYRRVLERNDIDAVLIATPDHWHSPIQVASCEAGKDVYVEKPVSNTIEAAQKMVAAAREHNRVVQVGCQQRSQPHFQECAKLVQNGYVGKVTHAVMAYPGGYTTAPEPVEPPPAELDWEAWLGPAPRRDYRPSLRRWRAYYDYGGGLITDWGVHLTDITNWYLDCNRKGPRLTSGSGQYVNVEVPEKDQVPDAFVVTWQYGDFVASFTNVVLPNPGGLSLQGNFFYGDQGTLIVNRSGYEVRPSPPRRQREGEPEPPPPIEARDYRPPRGAVNSTVAHTRNFLDCVKSRQQPVCDMEIGFYSTLPCLLGVLAIRQGRSFTWDGDKAWPA